jgi:ubiquitin-like-conjugating enzyme ATG3
MQGEDGWSITHSERVQVDPSDIPDIDMEEEDDHMTHPHLPKVTPKSAQDDIPDMEDMALPDDEDDEVVHINSDTVKTRTYDLIITYDKYYRTPRLWLSGYTESGSPLGPSEIMQDVSVDYADKTVTWEPFPHYSFDSQLHLATVHPCRHASVMHILIERMNSANREKGKEDIRIDQYLVIFLKFMSSVLPTIEHDNTLAI